MALILIMKIVYHQENHIKPVDQPTWKPIRTSQCFALQAYFIAAIASGDTPSPWSSAISRDLSFLQFKWFISRPTDQIPNIFQEYHACRLPFFQLSLSFILSLPNYYIITDTRRMGVKKIIRKLIVYIRLQSISIFIIHEYSMRWKRYRTFVK